MRTHPITFRFLRLSGHGAQPKPAGPRVLLRDISGHRALPEQHEIVRLLDEQFEAIERNEREIDAALRKSEALRQAILKKAFTGRLVPQDPADEPASALLHRIKSGRVAAEFETKRHSVRRKEEPVEP